MEYPKNIWNIILLILLVVLLFFALGREDSVNINSYIKDGKFKIIIVGEGISDSTSSEKRIYPINRAQALAMSLGALCAFDKSPAVQPIKKYIHLERKDDFGKKIEACRIAQESILDPLLLAVIGHSSSGTTYSAISIYSKIKVPLIMPIATSPNVISKTSFRLPLDDMTGQSPTLIYLIVEKIKARKIYIIKDVSEDAPDYSTTLVESFKKLLPSSYYGWEDEANVRSTRFLELAHSIKDNKSDAVLFIGYSTTANRLISSLRDVYINEINTKNKNHGDESVLPILVFSDGCISPDLNVYPFEAYLTAPMPDLDSIMNKSTEESKIFVSIFKDNYLPSYQIFGYDSMLVIADAIKKSIDSKTLCRDSIVENINKNTIEGLFSLYSFRAGQNTHGSYFVYKLSDKNEKINMELFLQLSYSTLFEISQKYDRLKGY